MFFWHGQGDGLVLTSALERPYTYVAPKLPSTGFIAATLISLHRVQ